VDLLASMLDLDPSKRPNAAREHANGLNAAIEGA